MPTTVSPISKTLTESSTPSRAVKRKIEKLVRFPVPYPRARMDAAVSIAFSNAQPMTPRNTRPVLRMRSTTPRAE